MFVYLPVSVYGRRTRKKDAAHRNDFRHPVSPEADRTLFNLCAAHRVEQAPVHFALMPGIYQSPSELRSLSGLRNTDGCTNYRTDPVRV